MRTLLAESFPPNWPGNENLPGSENSSPRPGWNKGRLQAVSEAGIVEIAALAGDSPEAAEIQRTFSEGPVLASGADLMEVGVDGKVIVTPSASRTQNVAALGRGIASSSLSADPLDGRTPNEIPFAA